MKYFKIDRVKLFCFFLTTVWLSVSADEFDLYNEIANQSSDPSSYYAVVNSYKQQASSMSESEKTNAKAALRIELFKLMKNVPAKSGQYDITSFVKNPSFANVTTSGWWWNSTTTIDDWTVYDIDNNNNSFTVNNKSGVVECYNVTNSARIYQVINDMPAGDYTVKVKVKDYAGYVISQKVKIKVR